MVELLKYTQAKFKTLQQMIAASSEAIEPPERLTITEAAVRYVKIREKNYSGPWSVDRTPYIVEPQNELASMDFDSMILAAPARTGKSQIFLNWLAYTAICDPMDMMLLHMTTNTARNWSLSDLAKMIRNSPDFARKLKPGRTQDNVFDKEFTSGMRLQIVHPSINELSGKTVGRNWAMDLDRMPEDIDGEGDPFTLLKKRAETLKRYGMTAAESSPGKDISDPKWEPSTPHEAPPCSGILGLYNDGDRRRWYWRCHHCATPFEGEFSMLTWPDSTDPMECAEGVVLVCPHCGGVHEPRTQFDLNNEGRWIKEGQIWMPDGSVQGKPRRTKCASFWLKGVAAGFTTWPELVLKYLAASQAFERDGSENRLRSVTNTDLGLPYVPKAVESAKLPETLREREEHYNERGVVPPGVAFLMSMIDVQGGSKACFVVHTFGITPVRLETGEWAYDVFHVDMWKIRKSNRLDADGEHLPIDPATYPEDWSLITSEVIDRKYPLGDNSGRFMRVKLVGCDSGGSGSSLNKTKGLTEPPISVTSNAYSYWRTLRQMNPVDQARFNLLKGAPARVGGRPDIYRTFPDSGQKGPMAIARGDVPVWLINSNQVKDQVSNMLGRTVPGGQVHFPIWYDENGNRVDTGWLYSQLTTEVRDARGWVNPSRRKNEAFDLLAYCVAFMKHPDIRFNSINFADPPSWANPEWDKNSLVFTIKDGIEASEATPKSARERLAQLGSQLG